jgi:hypothetical protein
VTDSQVKAWQPASGSRVNKPANISLVVAWFGWTEVRARPWDVVALHAFGPVLDRTLRIDTVNCLYSFRLKNYTAVMIFPGVGMAVVAFPPPSGLRSGCGEHTAATPLGVC